MIGKTNLGKSLIIGLSVLLGIFTQSRLASADDSATPTIFVCGDSTAHNTAKDAKGLQMEGWGTAISDFFDTNKVKVANVAHAGTSSMTYYNGDWPNVLPKIQKGDYVLIVFGINDGTTPDGTGPETRPSRGGRIAHTYGWYMSKMCTDSEEKGAHPFLLTVTARNIWTNPLVKYRDATPITTLPSNYDPSQDKIERGTGNGKYTQWTKDVGAAIHVPVFDLTNYCADKYESMGRETVNKFYSDHNHTYPPGADMVASCVVAGLKGFADSPFTPLLSDKGQAIQAADPKYVSNNPTP